MCQDKSCETLGYVSGDPQEECKMMSGCTFHEEIQFCSTTGKCSLQPPSTHMQTNLAKKDKTDAFSDFMLLVSR